MGKKLPVELNR